MSIVVASFSGEARLRSCLDSLETEHGGAEVIVSAALDPLTMDRLRQRYAWTRFAAAPAGADVFQLRAHGLAHATGAVAVLLEDHCIVPSGWLRALASAAAGPTGFAGGAVESSPGMTLEAWALYLVEYGALMPPATGSEGGLLAVNAAYPREALQACRTVWQDGFHDREVHDALRAHGHVPRLVPGATVRSDLCLSWRQAVTHLYGGGRRFGAFRRARWSGPERILRILAAPAAAVLLTARIVGHVARRRPWALPRLVQALPLVASFVTAWSAGELVGHVRPLRGGTP